MTEDDSNDNDSVTIEDLGVDGGHQTEKGRFNQDGSEESSSDSQGSDE